MEHKQPKIRRIVTGQDETDRSVVWRDGDATNTKWMGETVSSTLMWVTDAPADYLTDEDAGDRITGTAPPDGGTRFTVMEFQPGEEDPGMHRTDTVDYVLCLSGEIDMVLDEGTVTMHAGDVMINRGAHHGWVNRSAVPARVAVILVDGAPKRSGSVAGTADAP